jgi:hypothetical protein
MTVSVCPAVTQRSPLVRFASGLGVGGAGISLRQASNDRAVSLYSPSAPQPGVTLPRSARIAVLGLLVLKGLDLLDEAVEQLAGFRPRALLKPLSDLGLALEAGEVTGLAKPRHATRLRSCTLPSIEAQDATRRHDGGCRRPSPEFRRRGVRVHGGSGLRAGFESHEVRAIQSLNANSRS